MSAPLRSVPVCRDDAGHRLRRAARGLSAILPVWLLIGLVLLFELVWFWAVIPPEAEPVRACTDAGDANTNTQALGHLLYTRYIYLFQAAA